MAYTNIDRPLDNFVVTTWSGNDVNGRTISNGEFQPDFLWMFNRNIAGSCPGVVYNSTIGAGTDSTAYGGNSTGKYNAVFTSLDYGLTGGDFYRYGYLSGLTSTGFTCAAGNDPSGYQNYRHNQTGYNYVAWQWKANGGTTSSNTDGTVTSTVQANQDAGFSIITYVGSGTTNDTIGHGLGEEPDIAIFKRLDAYGNWDVQENSGKSGPVSVAFRHTLNLTEGIATNVLSSFSNTTIGLSTGGDAQKNISGSDYVCYAFKGKQGYSKFGTYYGNGSTDGKFVYLGFKPALIIFKVLSDPNHGWSMIDNTRSPFNLMDDNLFANASTAETTDQNKVDFLSNGFKCRGSTYPANAGGTNVFSYFAFAENPFVTSTGVPTTAR